jgi:AhpD family alkylhydroperoxidase
LQILDKILFYKIAPRQVRYLRPLDYRNATGLARAAIEQMEQDFVVGPPITVHLPNPELMTGIWSMARECLAAGGTRRARGEVVAAAVSRLNTCPYCLDIHSSMLHSHGLPDAAEARAMAEWANATLTPGAGILAHPPFTPEEIPQMAGTALCFHYLNRMVNVFLESSPLLITRDGWMKQGAVRLSGRVLRSRLVNQHVAPGRFLAGASEAALPPEFAWAAPNVHITGGILRFISAVEQAAEESVPPRVRECVAGHVEEWRGEGRGPDGRWLDDAVVTLGDHQRPAARLALATALASWRVDEVLVADFRVHQPSDRDLINLTSWASSVAVRRIASWVSPGQDLVAARTAR